MINKILITGTIGLLVTTNFNAIIAKDIDNTVLTNTPIEEMFLEGVEINESNMNTDFSTVSAYVSDENGDKLKLEIREYLTNRIDYGNIHSRVYVAKFEEPTPYSGTYDGSYSYYAYINVLYSKQDRANGTYYLLQNVNGSWSQRDATVGISNRRVSYSCQSGRNTGQVVYSRPINTNQFSFPTNFLTYVEDDGVFTAVGAYSQATLSHGGSEWMLEVREDIVLRSGGLF